MTSTSLVAAYPPPPFCANSVQIQASIEALGVDLTVEFLLKFGGAELYISRDPKGKSQLESLVGRERARALGQINKRLQKRVPLEKPWTARYLAWKGLSTAEITRRLHSSDVAVRRWVKLKPKRK